MYCTVQTLHDNNQRPAARASSAKITSFRFCLQCAQVMTTTYKESFVEGNTEKSLLCLTGAISMVPGTTIK